MIRAWVFSLLMLAGAAAPPCVDAPFCKCGLLSVEDELARSDAVFLGVVVHVGEMASRPVPVESRTGADTAGRIPVAVPGVWAGNLGMPVTLRAHRVWKGVAAGDRVTVRDTAACAVGFQVGQAYVVYAVRENGVLATSYCMRTRSLPAAPDDERVLDSIARAARP